MHVLTVPMHLQTLHIFNIHKVVDTQHLIHKVVDTQHKIHLFYLS
jgi:hypothetical protein